MTRKEWIAKRVAVWVDEDVSWKTIASDAAGAVAAFSAAANALEAADTAPWPVPDPEDVRIYLDRLHAFGKAMDIPPGRDILDWAAAEIESLHVRLAAKTLTPSDTATKVVEAAMEYSTSGADAASILRLLEAVAAHRATLAGAGA